MLKIGDRVESHPATDAWIFGDRYGTVVKITRTRAHVRMDRSGKVLRFTYENVLTVN
jgi:hypothetical protein